MKTVTISKSFKQKTTRAILSIVLFAVTYILLIILAIGLTIGCGYAGIMLIAAKPSLATLLLGAGLMSIGLLTLFFLIKFIFTSNKADLSGFTEITKEEEPEIFAMIDDIVKQVETDFPKHIYISSQVNASVFYDSNFWSMIFPVKKNLHIGLGLMNAVTADEFKGILAHEFGHFSQRSMKVGSYVYNVNYVIHNMLYDNDSYEKIVGRWASINGYITLFVMLGVKIVMGIQWILKQVYQVVNINYLALSREMEFHADEVAANVAGSQALATSLLRINLANQSRENVLAFYSDKIAENIKTADIFPQQFFVMSFLAGEYGLTNKQGLPQVTLHNKDRFNKSKLAFDDQWASHPSDEDRIKRLDELNIVFDNSNTSLATTLLKNPELTQEKITATLFYNVEYSGETKLYTVEDFKADYLEMYNKNSLDKKYNNYFNSSRVPVIAIDDIKNNLEDVTAMVNEEDLFSETAVENVYTVHGIEEDLAVLNDIASGKFKLKTFDYQGIRYRHKEIPVLLPKMEGELKNIKLKVEDNDKKIFRYYYNLAEKSGKASIYKVKYNAFINYYNNYYTNNTELLNKLIAATEFINVTTKLEAIPNYLSEVKPLEYDFKESIKNIVENDVYSQHIDKEAKEALQKYLLQEAAYFTGESYNEEALQTLFIAMQYYNTVNDDLLFKLKKDFLDFQAGLSFSATETVAGHTAHRRDKKIN